MEMLSYIGSIGGIAGVLAFVIFLMYRQDRKCSEDRLREDRKFMEDRLTLLIQEDQHGREKNTEVLSQLVTLITRLNGKLKPQ
jgi:hypothetical protein